MADETKPKTEEQGRDVLLSLTAGEAEYIRTLLAPHNLEISNRIGARLANALDEAASEGSGAASEPEKRRCPDDGVCHHECRRGECWRVHNACPLTAYGESWPPEIVHASATRSLPDPGTTSKEGPCEATKDGHRCEQPWGHSGRHGGRDGEGSFLWWEPHESTEPDCSTQPSGTEGEEGP